MMRKFYTYQFKEVIKKFKLTSHCCRHSETFLSCQYVALKKCRFKKYK